MRKNTKKLCLIHLALIGFLLLIPSNQVNVYNISAKINNYRVPNSISADLADHEPIKIIVDKNFTDYGFSGSGIETNPFVIEDYRIITTEDNGIYVYGTTKYFVIRNCYIEAKQYGIQINSVLPNTASLINNTCTNNERGIYATWSAQIAIINNTCYNNDVYGIDVSSSSSAIIFNNTCQSNGFNGMMVGYSDSYIIANNTITDDGIDINAGIFSNYYTYIIENNTVNGKEFGYLINETEKTLDGSIYGELYLINCTNSTISDLDISFTGDGVSLTHCSNITIKNSFFKNNTYAIYSYESFGNIKITDNTFETNDAGIYIQEIFDIEITNNFFESNINPIYLTDSNDSLVAENTFYKNEWGFSYSDSNTSLVTRNLFQETKNFAVIMGYDSYDSVIYHNTFEENNPGFQQARDEGENNIWYNDTLQEGNYWSNWGGTGSYSIYGSASSEDLYPLANPIVPIISEFIQIKISLILLLIPTVTLIMIVLLKKKKREKS